MAEVTVSIMERRYRIACRDGDEERILALAAEIDRRAREIEYRIGPQGEGRLLVAVALLLADELEDARAGVGVLAAGQAERLAARLDALAESLASADGAS